MKAIQNEVKKCSKSSLEIIKFSDEYLNLNDIEDIVDKINLLENNSETLFFNFKGEGCDAKVFAGGKYAVKKYDDYSPANLSYDMGIKLNKYNCVAKTYAFIRNPIKDYFYLITENIEGGTLYDNKYGIATTTIKKVYDFINECMEMSMNEEVTLWDLHDNNIIVSYEGDLKIIDFGEFENGEDLNIQDNLSSVFSFVRKMEFYVRKIEDINILNKEDIYLNMNYRYEDNDTKEILDIIQSYIKNDKDERLTYIGHGDHSMVYSFISKNKKQVLKVMRSPLKREGFCDAQLDVMKRLSPEKFHYFTKNHIIYHDKENSALYVVQEFVEGDSGEDIVGTVNEKKIMLCRQLKMAINYGVIPFDLTQDNVKIDKNGNIELFDTSYMTTINRYDYDELNSYHRLDGVLSFEKLLNVSYASNWIW